MDYRQFVDTAAKPQKLEMTSNDDVERKRGTNDDRKFSNRTRNREEAPNDNMSSKKKTLTVYECDVCLLTFCKRSGLNRHLDRFEEAKYLCDKCDMKFHDSDLLRCHAVSVHNAVTMKYKLKCPICNQEIRLERNFQSHMCHGHRGWENAININQFVAECDSENTETRSYVADRNLRGSEVTDTSKKRHMRKLISCLIKALLNGDEEQPISIVIDNTKLGSVETSSIVEQSGSSRCRGDFKKTPNPILARNNFENESSSAIKSNLNGVAKTSKAIRSKSSRRSSKRGRSNNRKLCRVAALRKSFSCKDCYVPLSRIDTTKKTSTNDAIAKPRRTSTRVEVSSNDSQTCDESRRPVKRRQIEFSEIPEQQQQQLQQQQQQQQQLQQQITNEKTDCSKLIDVEVRLERLPILFVKAEINDRENCVSPGTFAQALNECCDLPMVKCESELNNGYIDETVTTGYSTECLPTSIISGATEMLNTTDGLEHRYESSISTMKSEPMDCEFDDYTAVTTESFFVDYPISIEYSTKIEPSYANSPETPEEFAFVSTDVADPQSPKIEIVEDRFIDYPDCETVVTTSNCPDASGNDEPELDAASQTDFTSSENIEAQQLLTRVASRICDRTFSGRRGLLKHARERHLSYYGDTVYCPCGKEMIGRRAIAEHFWRHCGKVIETTESINDLSKPCNPLEKKYTCERCGEQFWLESCLIDHPPRCNNARTEPSQPVLKMAQRYKKLNTGPGYRSNGSYVCHICNVKFGHHLGLMRHIRSFTMDAPHLCNICQTIFPGSRLLRHHMQSAHELNYTTSYTYACDICNQGFTKKIYKRVHMIHIHGKEPFAEPPLTVQKRCTPVDGLSGSSVLPGTVAKTSENQCVVCNLIFVNRKRYLDHMSYYEKTEIFGCNMCGERFRGQYKAHNHRKEVHYVGDMQKIYGHRCAICREGFAYKTHLHAHMFHVHDEEFDRVSSITDLGVPDINEQSTEEQFAGEQFTKEISVSSIVADCRSVNDADNAVSGDVRCDRCGEEFSTWSEWISHSENAHSQDTEDPLGLRFTNATVSPSDESVHVEVSGSNESVNVEVSGSNESVNVEVSGSNESVNVEVSTSTEIDDRTADANSEVRRSIEENRTIVRRSTNEKNERPDDRQTVDAQFTYQNSTLCEICGLDCPGPYGLIRHRAMHSNSGSYVCEFCGRRFRWQSTYRDHKLKHFRRDVHNNCFCPICDEGFDDVQCLESHTLHLHNRQLRKLLNDVRKVGNSHETAKNRRYERANNDNRDSIVRNDDNVDVPDGNRTRPTCYLCRTSFVNESTLKTHCETVHSSFENYATIARPPRNTKLRRCGDRFYVSLGDDVNPQLVDSIGKNVFECNRTVGLTSSFYRYDNSVECKICHLTFTTTDSLNVHEEISHPEEKDSRKVGGNVVRTAARSRVETVSKATDVTDDTTEIVEIQSSTDNSTEVVEIRSSTDNSTEVMEIRTSTDDRSVNFQTERNQSISGDSPVIGEVTSTASDPIVDRSTRKQQFVAIHEKQLHRLTSSDGGVVESTIGRANDCQPQISQLPMSMKKSDITEKRLSILRNDLSEFIVDRESSSVSSVDIVIPNNQTQEIGESSSITKNLGSVGNKKMRFINLPPGNYKISKLKMRPVGVVSGMFLKNINGTINRTK